MEKAEAQPDTGATPAMDIFRAMADLEKKKVATAVKAGAKAGTPVPKREGVKIRREERRRNYKQEWQKI